MNSNKSNKLVDVFDLKKKSPQELAYIDQMNMLAAKWISLVLGVLGVLVLITSYVIPVQVSAPQHDLFSSTYWKGIHTFLYIILSLTCFLTFIFSNRYIRHNSEPSKKRHTRAAMCVLNFVLIVNLFGMIISAMDYQAQGQTIAFICTVIVTYAAFRIHPIKIIISMTAVFVVFFALITMVPLFDKNLFDGIRVGVTYRFCIDFTVLYVLMLAISFHLYHSVCKAAQNSVALENVSSQIKELPSVDSLTKLGNRLQLKTEQHLYYNKNIIMMMVDLNDFKKFNELFGYHVGDQVFRKYAKIITTTFSNASIYRWDNDQFLIVSYDTLYDFKKKIEIYKSNMASYSYQGVRSGFSSGYAFGYVTTKDEFNSVIKKAEYELFVEKLSYKKNAVDDTSIEEYYTPSYYN